MAARLPFLGFDAEIATGGAPQTPVQSLAGDDADGAAAVGAGGAGGRSAYQVGVDFGVPPGIARAYLLELGLDDTHTPVELLDFEPDDLTAARRTFMAEEGSQPTPRHRALVVGWMRALAAEIDAAGPPPASILDAGYRAARRPPQLALSAPAAPAEEATVHSNARGGTGGMGTLSLA